MARDVWTQEALFEGLSLSESFVKELRRHRLIRVVGFDADGRPLFGPEARDELARVMALVELGYKPSDISAIAGRVGLPSVSRGFMKRRFTHRTLDEASSKLGVPLELLRRWVDDEIVRPSHALQDGGVLLTESEFELVSELWDLNQLGFEYELCARWSGLREQWSGDGKAAAMEEDSLRHAQEFFEAIEARLRLQRQARRRWDRRLSGLKRALGRRRRSAKRRAAGSQRLRRTKRGRRRGA